MNIAELGIKVESASAEQAGDALDALVQSGARAEQAAGKVGAAWDAAGKKVTTSATSATASIEDQREELSKLIGQIDPTVAALDRLDAQQKKLQGFKSAGLIDSETFERFNSRLEQTRTGLSAFDDNLNRTGNTAKQTAAALRGVPAQFTDIVVSLQAGQAPLTVLLQQGGQLKDMFGGIGPAASALGGYVTGLINPFTLAAAAVGGLAFAFIDAERESSAFNKTLFAGNGSIALSAGQLQELSRQAGAVVGNMGSAREAFLAIGTASDLSNTQVKNLGQAAAAISEYSGKSAADVAQQFSKLGDSATDAAQKASSQYGLITSAQYEVIAALEQQGKTQEALDVLSESLNQGALKRLELYRGSLSDIEKDWQAVKRAISGAYSAVKADLFPDVSRKIEQLESLRKLSPSTRVRSGFILTDAEIDTQIAGLKKLTETTNEAAESRAEVVKQDRANIEAQGKWASDAIKYRTAEKKLDDDIKQIREDGAKAGAVQAQIEERIAFVREQAAKKVPKERKIAAPALDTTSVNNVQNQLKLVVGEYENADRKIEAAAQAGLISQKDASTQRLALLDKEKVDVKAAYDAQIASIEALQGRGNLSAQQRISLDQKLSDAQAAQAKALEDIDAKRDLLATKETGRLKKLELSTDSYTAALNAQLDALKLQGERAAASVGMGREQAALYNELQKVTDDYTRALRELDNQLNQGLDPDEYKKRKDRLIQQQDDLRDQTIENYQKLRIEHANWVNGATSAWNDYLSKARDVSTQTRDAFTDALTGMEDFLLSFITGTKASFKDLVRSIIADFSRIQLKQIIGGVGTAVGLTGSTIGIPGASGGATSGGLSLANIGQYGTSAYNFLTGAGSGLYQAYQSGGLGGIYNYGTSAIGKVFAPTVGGGQGVMLDAAGNLVNYGAGGVLGSGVTVGAAGAYGLGGALYGYQQSGLKGAVAGGLGSAGGAIAGGATATALGAAAGSFVPVIGTAIGAALGGLLGGSLFGGSWQTKDAGIALGVEGGDLSAQQYEYQKKKGGLFSKNKKRTRLSAPDEATQAYLDTMYDGSMAAVEGLFEQFGITISKGAIDGLQVATTQISTKGKSDEEVNTLISQWFDTTFDSITDQLNVAMGSQFREGLTFSGLSSLLNNLVAVNAGLDQINVTALKLSPASTYAADALRQFSGGMEQFGANVNSYYQGFFSQTEREDDALAALRKQFEVFNLVLPDTREQYRKLVESMDVTYDAGQKTLSFLLAQAGTAASTYDVLERRAKEAADAQKALADAQANAAKAAAEAAAQQQEAARQARISYADAMQQAYTADVQRAMAGITNAIKAEQDALTESYNAQVNALNARISASGDIISSLTSMTSGLSGALKQLLGQSDAATAMLYQQGRATLESAAAIAKAGGSLASFEGLDQALDAVTGNSADRYSNWEDFARDQGRAANLIDELNKAAGGQLSVEQRTLETLNKQLDQGKSAYDAQMKAFQGQIDLAQQQLDTLNGISSGVLSVKDALAQFATALGAAYTGQQNQNNAGSGASLDSQIGRIYNQVLGRNVDASGLDFWKQKVTSGSLSAGDLQKAIAAGAREYISVYGIDSYRQQYGDKAADAALKIPAFANGGLYSPGAALVGERGPEIINFTKPGYVHTAAETSRILGGSGSAEVVRELQALRQENRDMRMALSEIAKHTRGTRDELRQQNDTGVKLETA